MLWKATVKICCLKVGWCCGDSGGILQVSPRDDSAFHVISKRVLSLSAFLHGARVIESMLEQRQHMDAAEQASSACTSMTASVLMDG